MILLPILLAAEPLAQTQPPPSPPPADPAMPSDVAQPEACATEVAAVNAVSDRYAGEQQQIEDDGKEIGDHPEGHHISGTIKFKRRDFIFNIPAVTMRPKTMSLDLPQMTMRQKKISWDNVVIVMRDKVVGKYPTTKCNWHGCTVKWKDIIIKVPTSEIRRQEISTDIPQLRMAHTSFVTSVPYMTMKKTTWSTDIPEITVDSPIPTNGPTDQEDDAKKLQGRAEALAGKINQDVADSTTALFACYRGDLTEKRAAVATQFEQALAQLDGSIKATKDAGADPAKLQSDEGTINLIAQRDDLIAQRDKALAQIDDSLSRLGTSQDTTLVRAVNATEAPAETPPTT